MLLTQTSYFLYFLEKLWHSNLTAGLLIFPIFYFLKVCPRVKSFNRVFPKELRSRIFFSSSEKDDQPSEVIFGKWFLGYVYSSTEESGSVWILSTKATFEELVADNMDEDEVSDSDDDRQVRFERSTLSVEKKRFQIVNITGAYHYRQIKFQICNPIDRNPTPSQRRILDRIINLPKKTQVIGISGEPGVGKSFIADLLAKEIFNSPRGAFEKASEIRYVFEYNPTTPNTFFSQIYKRCEPNEKKRLIVLIDEIDVILERVHHKLLPPNHKFPIEVQDKPSWNRWLDNFDRGYYPWTTLIMTSNRDKSYIEGLDPSYLREGRIDFWETMSRN